MEYKKSFKIVILIILGIAILWLSRPFIVQIIFIADSERAGNAILYSEPKLTSTSTLRTFLLNKHCTVFKKGEFSVCSKPLPKCLGEMCPLSTDLGSFYCCKLK
jgi:hypothetical protein